MFVLTMDRRRSRSLAHDDIGSTMEDLQSTYEGALASRVARFAGDELQLATRDASTAISILLRSTRDGAWSVGLGIGAATLADDPAAANGPAFFAARTAVETAKKARSRAAIAVEHDTAAFPSVADASAMLDAVITIRDRRSPAGWEVYDLLADLGTQRAVAEHLGITDSAVSARSITAALQIESEVVASLARMVDAIDRSERDEA